MADVSENICTDCGKPYFFMESSEHGVVSTTTCPACTKKSDLEITSSELQPGVKPRKLRATWRFDSTEELRRLRDGNEED